MKWPLKRRVVILLALLCVAGGVLLFRPGHGRTGDAQFLSSPPPVQRSKLEFLGRWMWPLKRQIARAREKILGAPTMIDAHGLMVEIDPAMPLHIPDALVSLTNQNGDALFVFPNSGFDQALKEAPGVKVLTTARMTVLDRMQAQIQVADRVAIGTGTNMTLQWVGSRLDVWPFARGHSVELACFFSHTERAFRETGEGESPQKEMFIRTNTAFGAKVSVPRNGLLFLLSRGTNQNGKIVGALLSAGVQKK